MNQQPEMNNYSNEQEYQAPVQEQYQEIPAYETPAPVEEKKNTIALISLILGCVALIINPFFLCHLGAIVLGIIGIVHSTDKGGKGMAIAGLCLGLFVTGCEIILAFLTMGMSFFC